MKRRMGLFSIRRTRTHVVSMALLIISLIPALYASIQTPPVHADAINTTDFVFTVDTTKTGGATTNLQFQITYNIAYVYNYSVDCNNDGVYEATGQTGTYICNYATTGVYTIRIGGTFPQLNGTNDKVKVTQINQWGNVPWRQLYFAGYANLDVVAIDTPNLAASTSLASAFASCPSLIGTSANWAWNTSTITNMGGMFIYDVKFNGSIGDFTDTSHVTNMNMMLRGATVFNNNGSASIGNWNVGNVTDMGYMFLSNPAFNQNIGAWNTAKVTNMTSMFKGAAAFNNGGSASINTWNTGLVTSMQDMFNGASAFNQPIGNWNTGNVANMSLMFNAASVFNQDIGAWTTVKVTNMTSMFNAAAVFNNGGSATISNWNTGLVTNMSNMFYLAAAFNQNIGAWNTANVTTMESMFIGATVFNQPIGTWTTGNVINMRSMFQSAAAFNQDIGSWDTSKVTSMWRMFLYATVFNNGGSASINNWNTGLVTNMDLVFYGTAFNQDISGWNFSNVTSAVSFLNIASSFSTPNYDKLLISISGQAVKTGVGFTGNRPQYCLGANARNTLITTYTWSITANYGCAAYQPVAMSVPAVTIWENGTPPLTIGAPTTTDTVPNTLDTYTYSLTCTTHGAQDGLFSIVSGELVLNSTVDYETTPTLNVCVRVTNVNGQTYDKLFSLPVSNILTLSYSGNGNTSGTPPAASETYSPGSSATVSDNTGSLARTGFAFNGWNTVADGSGTHYTPNDTLTMNSDATLYAQWLSTDTTSPTVVVARAGGQANPTNANSATFTITFSEPVVGFVASKVTLAGTATGTVTNLSTSDNTTFTATVTGMTNADTVTATVAAGATADAAGNLNEASTGTDNSVTYYAPDLSAAYVDNTGTTLATPNAPLPGVVASTAPTTSAAPFLGGSVGTSGTYLRVYNSLSSGWNASIAATGGTASTWNRNGGGASYGYNSSAGGGALTVNPAAGSIFAYKPGCSTAGITFGANSTFSQGTVDSITLASNSSSALGCYYDLGNMSVSQVIPAAQATGDCTLNLTVTVVAQ